MKARLHLCTFDDLGRLLPLVEAFHEEEGIFLTDEARQAALVPLLEGTPHGAAYLIGPKQAPVGYVILSFGWSVEFGGIDAILDEFWIRPGVRGKGMGTDALMALVETMKGAAIKALHLEVDREGPAAHIYRRAGFAVRDRYSLMTRRLDRP